MNNNYSGKIISIEGNDGAGKETQSKLLEKYFKNEGKKVIRISFPRYDSGASYFVKKYLNGDYENNKLINIDDIINFYILDMKDAFVEYDIENELKKGTIFIFDRYIDSTIIYQSAKIIDDTLESYRFAHSFVKDKINKSGLPKPDITIYLSVSPNVSASLRANRANKIDNSDKLDIHESNIAYLNICNKVMDKHFYVYRDKEQDQEQYELLTHSVIYCDDGETMYSKADIFEKMVSKINNIF